MSTLNITRQEAFETLLQKLSRTDQETDDDLRNLSEDDRHVLYLAILNYIVFGEKPDIVDRLKEAAEKLYKFVDEEITDVNVRGNDIIFF